MVCLEWIQTTEYTLRYCWTPPEDHVAVAILHFHGAARVWWHRLVTERERCGQFAIDEWHQLLYIMHKKYVPSNYTDQIRLEIAMGHQGSLNPLEFYSKLEDMLYKVNISATPATLRCRFLAGLNTSICDRLEVLPIKDINSLMHAAM